MKLFGLDITVARNGKYNGHYVKREECHVAQRRLEDCIEGLKDHLDLKIDTKFDALNNRITDLLRE